MKADIHPKYVECNVTCGCGNKFVTRSTKPQLSVEICYACHPFYTGKQKYVDSAGRVEKFQKRHQWTDEARSKVVEKATQNRKKKRKNVEKPRPAAAKKEAGKADGDDKKADAKPEAAAAAAAPEAKADG